MPDDIPRDLDRDPEPYIPSHDREPHPKDVGRTPGRIFFTDGESAQFGHIDAHDGYVNAQYPTGGDDSTVYKFPWHQIEEVRLDL